MICFPLKNKLAIPSREALSSIRGGTAGAVPSLHLRDVQGWGGLSPPSQSLYCMAGRETIRRQGTSLSMRWQIPGFGWLKNQSG